MPAHPRLSVLFAATALALAAAAPASVAAPSASDAGSAASVWGALHWRLIGPFRAGRTLAVTGVAGQPEHFYMGSVDGGVWETHDTGRTWQPIFDHEPVQSIGAIAVAPSDPSIIYVGTGESDMRSDIVQGDGMYKSVDGGKTWTHIGLDDTQQIAMIRVDPHNPNRVFVAALGHPYGPNAQRGVFRSLDGGKTWKKVLGPNANTGAIDIIFKPGDANVIYAALWQTRRPPWNIYPPSNGPGSGLYKSTDGGNTWTHLEGHGFPARGLGRIGIAISAAAPDRIYAILDATDGGLYRSDDAGKNWKKTSGDPRIWQRGWYFGQIAADPRNANVVYAMNTIELRSTDGGKIFIPVKGDPTGDDYHELWVDPNDPNRQIMGSDQGASITVNGGKTWSTWYNQPTAQMYHVSTDNRFPYRVYGAQQDSGAVGIPSRSTYEPTINMTQFHEVTAGGENGMIAPDPDDPDIVYGGDTVEKLNLKTRQTRDVDATLAKPGLYRATWTLPLVFNAANHKTLYFGNQRVWQTSDGGEHWTAISPDLSRPDPAIPANLDAPTVADNLGQGPRRGVVYAIGSSPLNANLLWAGTDDGLIWRTDDDGAHWTNVTPRQLTAWAKVGNIEPSHFDQNTAFASVDRHRVDDRKPYIYRTTDGGKTWKLITEGIPDGDFVDVVREDPVKRGLLYAGTDFGVFVSFDDGDHWHSLQQNLPAVSVRDIDVKNDDLVIATHGRGFYIMDDISALRQLAAYPASWATRLYQPAVAYRVRMPMFTGTPLPKDEPMAENPPWGAYIDYSLAATPSKPIELSIYDANGKLVRSYSSADKAPQPNLAKINMTPDWFHEPVVLETTPGLHRFVWPLRYAPPAVLAQGDAYADGVWAPPGQYTVKLTVNGKTLSEPLTVAHDPRVTIPADAYVQQFQLAQQVEAEMAKLAVAQGEAQRLHAALQKARKGAGGELLKSIDALDAEVVAAADIVDSPNPYNAWTMPPDNTQNFRFLDGALASLMRAVDGADAAPSTDARTGYTELSGMLDASLKKWGGLKASQLTALNAKLKAAGKQQASFEKQKARH
ncbi:MAG: WD40/YVTN/BNR-like repeat-containing protein [Rhodanobacteraceae bacterium]